mgnify:CR=1 FL=1
MFIGGDTLIAGVLVEISNKNVDRIFEYNIPDNLIKDIKVGIRVLVPFGKMKLEGFVLEIKSEKSTNKELRDILEIVDGEIVLNDELMKLGKIISYDGRKVPGHQIHFSAFILLGYAVVLGVNLCKFIPL